MTKVRQVITKMLVENGYLESTDAKILQQVSINPLLEITQSEKEDRITFCQLLIVLTEVKNGETGTFFRI